MGAWGHGSFENDVALDWVFELHACQDASALRSALEAVTTRAIDSVDSDECCRALAAAEVVAALLGHPTFLLPREVKQWMSARPVAIDNELLDLAQRAVGAVMSESELEVLWAESSDEGSAWRATLDDLRQRLSR